jgi:hypothetical protein
VKKVYQHLLLITILIGIGSLVFPYAALIVWVVMILISISGALNNNTLMLWIPIAISPFVEVLSRMSYAPFVPKEIGKYFILLAILLLIIRQRGSSPRILNMTGLVILACLIPSALYALISFDLNYEKWVFNFLGIAELAILSVLASKERFSQKEILILLKFMAAFLVPILIFLTFRTPDFNEITFSLGANGETSGGFGSNQVSTILGLGLLINLVLVLLKKPFHGNMVAWAIIGYSLFRGLLTFSRGGMLVAGIAFFIFFIIFINPGSKALVRTLVTGFFMILVGGFIFQYSNSITGNLLSLRYQGETAGTLSGSREKDINLITSGRISIMEADFEIFKESMFTGVGPGRSMEIRSSQGKGDYVAHIEFSRLMAEHGLGGLASAIVLLFFAIYWTLRQKSRTQKAIVACFFILAIGTTFHAAMRTNTTVVCFALASIPLIKRKT